MFARCALVVAVSLTVIAPRTASAQHTSGELVALAESALAARHFDSAAVLLRSALALASDTSQRVVVLVWSAVWQHLSGNDSLSRVYVRTALEWSGGGGLGVSEDRLPSRVVELLRDERQRLTLLGSIIMTINGVDVQPVRLSGPPVKYPHDAWRRQVSGHAVIDGIVDREGRFEPPSLKIAVPDSALIEPVRAAMIATRFSPGRYRGQPVRTMLRLGIVLQPGPPPNPTALVTEARAQLAAGQADSALQLVEFALDPRVAATPGVRLYATLVQGIAWARRGRDSLARTSFDKGLADYAALTRGGIDLAPTLRHLADSVKVASRGAAARSRLGTPATAAPVNQQPVLASSPPIDYPPEMRALRVGGLVVVEVTIDTTGAPVSGSARIVQTANPGLDQAALRVVAGTRYRPARRGGRPVRVVVRQPITFSP
jgi:TonB family protein